MPQPSADYPITVPCARAMRRLGIGRTKMASLCARGVFTVVAPNGRGVGKPFYLLLSEVEVYDRTRSEQAVIESRGELA